MPTSSCRASKEIAASSQSLDVRDKLESYRRAGVPEYIVWRTEDRAVDWWGLEKNDYRPLERDKAGVIQSRVFPGLWMDSEALLTGNGLEVMAKLQEGLRSPPHTAFLLQLQRFSQGTM